MPARLPSHALWRSLFAVIMLVCACKFTVGHEGAYGCGPSPEVGKPLTVPST